MKEKLSLIAPIRKELLKTIRQAVKEKGCIGTFYKNIGKHHTEDQTTEEYENSPIVVVHNGQLGSYSGFEAASVYDLYIENGLLKCTLNGESGEDWDELLTNVQVEGLMCIVSWLYENNFLLKSQEEEILVNRILGDDQKCERFAEIIHEQMVSDDEPLDKIGASVIRAYMTGDTEALLITLTGWGLNTLINRTINIDEGVLYIGSSLLQKMESKLQKEYLPDNYEDDTIYELAQNEFQRIKSDVCTECGFDEDAYQKQNGGDSLFDEHIEHIYNKVYSRIIPCKKQ